MPHRPQKCAELDPISQPVITAKRVKLTKELGTRHLMSPQRTFSGRNALEKAKSGLFFSLALIAIPIPKMSRNKRIVSIERTLYLLKRWQRKLFEFVVNVPRNIPIRLLDTLGNLAFTLLKSGKPIP